MDRSQRVRKLQSGGMQESGEMSPIPESAALEDDPLPEPTPAPKTPTKATRPPSDAVDR